LRRGLLLLAALLATIALVQADWAALRAQERTEAGLQFFRIGTASTAGTYFPIGGLLANAISNPPGSRSCESGGSCGVSGLIAVVQSTDGSVANVELIADRRIDSGFVQADVAFWAYKGKHLFAKRGPLENLRAIANLYPEAVHLVVRRNAEIHGLADLAGKRVSLDREGSGTRVDARLILEAYGLSESDLAVHDYPAGQAADAMRAGELDAFFFVAGTPARAIDDLAKDVSIGLLPIDGPEAEALQEAYPFFARTDISAGTYQNVAQTPTLSVGAQWLTSADLPEAQIYAITRALWNDSTRRMLDNGHPKGTQIRLDSALDGLGVPLHPGARRFYVEHGLIRGQDG
jgi:TRAP transporter TAXI family solute receptor